ncbi:zinc-regulated TonB-dependent outer membrane receptor [Ectothiorhodospira shaposhnikovii]|uniref:zinc-regulated TonB-dependent outer membrane receptor n=1 Tax=Ectothiorhodospira shaposhnikovii TaxID=1054 RepID=UPI003B8A865D
MTLRRLPLAAGLLLLPLSGLSAQEPPRGSTLAGASMTPLPTLGSERVSSGSAFNPDISVIIDTVYLNEFSGHVGTPAGFDGGHDHDHGHDHGHDHDHGLEEGFNFRSAELTFTASVDHYFDALLTLHLDEDHVEVEEAYITTRSLPAGLQIKAGKFLSDIGYINAQHTHDWAFVDRPLVNEYLFGDHGLQEKGVQLTWTPKTAFYSVFGLELLQGETTGIASYEGHGEGKPFSDKSGPRLITGFAKLAPDLGYNHAAQFGLSYGHARAFQLSDFHDHGDHSHRLSWDGTAWFAGVDAVYKYDAGRSFGHGDWVVQGEYYHREIDVDFRNNQRPTVSDVARQDGLYVQAVYGIAPRWQFGVRADALGMTNRNTLQWMGHGHQGYESFGTSYRYAANLTFRPTEFSLLRAQVNRADFASEDDHDEDGWAFMLQFQVALGVHGAHRF